MNKLEIKQKLSNLIDEYNKMVAKWASKCDNETMFEFGYYKGMNACCVSLTGMEVPEYVREKCREHNIK